MRYELQAMRVGALSSIDVELKQCRWKLGGGGFAGVEAMSM